jgi:hypothetical protein
MIDVLQYVEDLFDCIPDIDFVVLLHKMFCCKRGENIQIFEGNFHDESGLNNTHRISARP